MRGRIVSFFGLIPRYVEIFISNGVAKIVLSKDPSLAFLEWLGRLHIFILWGAVGIVSLPA